MRAPPASSRRSLTNRSPLMAPLTTAFDTRTSPLTRPLPVRVNTESAPSAAIEPSTTPSRCRPPAKRTSPRIVVPSAISVLIAATALPLRFSLPNIVALLALGCILPGKLLFDPAAVAIGSNNHAIGCETGGEHDGTAHLLEILEVVLEPGAVGVLALQ